MDVIQTLQAMHRQAREWVRQDATVALVPTMGGLHAGHCALIRQACEQADRVVVSVFVNPTQFGPDEDYDRYPRDLEGDCVKCAQAGADLIFAPSAAEMYPAMPRVFVVEEEIADQFEGASRAGHFKGVLTVVAKLFWAVQPQIAVFGRKDAQQLWLIQRMVRTLNIPVQIVAGATVRESDGLALSSRNAYLSPAHRDQATCLYRALQAAHQQCAAGERNAAVLRATMRNIIASAPDAVIDYIAIVDANEFTPVTTLSQPALALLAVRIGTTRLIDNLELTIKTEAI